MAKETKVKDIDITKSGPMTFRDLQEANQEPYTNLSPEFKSFSMNVGANTAPTSLYDARAHGEQMVATSLGGTTTPWGESMFDEPTATEEQFQNLGDIRADNQPWYAQIGAGLAKGAILAGTTFIDGTLGLVLGGVTAAKEGRRSGLWDNDFSRAMQSVNEWSEKALPNYYTKAEQEQPWYENIFTANFLGDKFIKNLGFTVGAFYSGGLEAAGIRGLGKLATVGAKRLGAGIKTLKGISKATSIVAAGLGSATSAVNEGRIEALNNSKDWFELHKAQLDDKYKQRLQSIKNNYEGTEIYDQLVEAETDAYNKALGKLTEDRLKMGNMDLLMNLPILMVSNVVQFGKLYANGFKTSRKAYNILGRSGEYKAGTTKLSAAYNVTKGALSEGTEEISQSAASRIAGNYYSTDVNNFYKSKTDQDAAKETLDWTKSFAEGINETVNDGSAWEEFFIGTLTGALGMPQFRSMRNAEGRFQSPITIEGGAINEWREYNEKIARENEIANYMNNRINSPEFKNYYQGLIRHNKYQNDMNQAAEQGDEFNFKNAEHAQLVSDIVMFDQAGKIEDLKSAINEASGTSQEDLESIVVNTTSKDKNGDLVGPFSQYASKDDNDNIVANFGTEEAVNEMASKINKNKEDIIKTIKEYQDIKDELILILKTGQQLSDDQLEELTWMKSQIGNWSDRATAMSGEIKSAIGSVLGNLDSFLRFNEQVREFEGQAHANITDRYRQADENVRAIQGAINTLNLVRSQDDKTLAYTLATNPKLVDGLIKEINEVDETVLSEDEKQDITTKLKDIVKLGNASKTYSAKLKEYLKNPQKQAEDHTKADEQAAQKEAKRKSDDLKTLLNAATTLRDFRTVVESQDDIENRDKVLKEMEDEGNNMAKNYRETSQYNAEVRRVINESDAEPQAKQDAMRLLQDQFNNSEDLEHLANPNSIYINNENAFDEESGGDVELSATRFQEAQYALQKAMSQVNNDNRFKDRFSPEYKKPVENRITTIPITGYSKSGKLITGEYIKRKDKGFTRVTYTGAGNAQFRVREGNFGLTREDLIGKREDYSSEELYNEVLQDLEEGIQITEAVLRPDKSVTIGTNSGITIDGEPAKVLYDKLFNVKEIKGDDRRDTGDSGTSTTPTVTSSEGLPTTELPVGNITAEMVNEENKKVNERAEIPQRPSRDTLNQFYRPAIPELHIEGSKEGDFRPFDVVASEREKNVDFSGIYGYLRDSGAFRYVNEGNLKAGDELGFMIDPDYNESTIFLIDKRNGQVVGSLDESDYSVSRYEGLKGLEEKIRSEYANRQNKTGKFVATPTTRVSKVMVGRVPYGNTERSLSEIPNVSSTDRKPIFGIIKNGVLTTNGKIDDSLIIKPVDMSQKEGRLYLLIPNGAGKYSPAAVRVKHFNNEEFNLDDTSVANTPIGKDISAAITKLSNSISQDDVSQAMQDLAQNLYMQDIMVTWFDGRAGSGIVISKKVRKPDGTYEKVTINGKEQIKEDKYDVYFSTSKKNASIEGVNFDVTALEDLGDTSALGTPRDPDDIYKEILGHLTKFNLPLQVSTKKINEGAYNNRLINSNILTSNITDASVRSTWFTTDYFDNEGNLHQAISPASVTPQPKRKIETPVGGTEGAIAGTKITSVFSNKTYYVDLKTNTIRDDQGRTVEVTDSNRILFDLAWAQDNFGDSTNSSMMVDNKVLTPSGKVLDRSTQKYLIGQEAQDVKDAITGRKKERGDRVAKSKEVISEIYENQKRVDKTRTDGEFYYVLEDDGQYHEYSRVHSRLGSNWVESPKQTEALTQIRTKLSQLVDTPAQFDNYLKFLENRYKISLDGYQGKTDAKSRDTIVNIVRDGMSGTNSVRALNAGTAVDSVIRQYFTVRDVSKIVRPDNMTENAFIDLITNLNRIKSNMEKMGERFLADNIVLFQKYPDGTRVAGEVDILSVDKDGNFRIYDVKTSRYSFYEFTDRYGHKVNYFTTPSATQKISAKDYYTLQLSAYKNLFESQYGVPVTKLAVMPFVLSYDKNNVSGVQSEKGIPITYNPAVNVPLIGNVQAPTQKAKAYIASPDRFSERKPYAEAHSQVPFGRAGEDYVVVPFEYEFEGEIHKSTHEVIKVGDTYYKWKLFSSRKKEDWYFGWEKLDEKYLEDVKRAFEEAVESKTPRVLPIFETSLETQNPIENITPEHKSTDKDKVGYFELDGKLHKGYITPLTVIDGIEIHVTKVPNITKGLGRATEVAHVASNSYYAVFPNGRTFQFLRNNPVKGGMTQSQVEDAIRKGLEAKPQKVKELASEKTILFDPDAVPTVSAAPITTVETPATINQGNTQTGAAYTAQKEQAVMEHDDEFEDELTLRRVDETVEVPIWNQEKELDWLGKVLPQLSESDRVKVVKGLIKVGRQGALAWGQFDKGVITLSDIAAEGTTYHEAFHAVFNLLLDQSERQALYDEARKLYGEKDNLSLEEDMAEGFREYVMTRQNRGLGRRILDFFRELFTKVTNWNDFRPSLISYYQRINAGNYAKTPVYLSTEGQLKGKRLWHTSDEIIYRFNKEMPEGYFAQHGGSPRAIFFADRAPESQSFLSQRKYKNQYDVVINNPYVVENLTTGKYNQDDKHKSMQEAIQYAMDNGYDSVIFKNLYDNMMYGDIYVVFDTSQVNYVVGQDNTGVDYGPNKFKDLPQEQWKVLVKKGWTEEQWNKVSQEERNHALKCIAF